VTHFVIARILQGLGGAIETPVGGGSVALDRQGNTLSTPWHG